MQRKIHNQTLFVAALSVYIGLLVIGTPHVLAQQSKFLQTLREINQSKHLTSNEIKKFEKERERQNRLTIEYYAQLNKMIAEEHFEAASTQFAWKREFSNGQLISSQLERAEGNLKIINFLHQKFLDADAKEPLTAVNIGDGIYSSNIKISQLEIVHTNTTTVASVSEVKLSTSTLQVMLREMQKNELIKAAQNYSEGKKVILDPLVMGMSITQINNQVFIVTRLPRAGLDEFLKANEKAN